MSLGVRAALVAVLGVVVVPACHGRAALLASTIERIEPDRALNTEDVTVVIHGERFYVRVTQRLDQTDAFAADAHFAVYLMSQHPEEVRTSVALQSVERIDTTKLQARIPAGLDAGVYDVSVLTPWGNGSTLQSAYEAIAPCDDPEDEACGDNNGGIHEKGGGSETTSTTP